MSSHGGRRVRLAGSELRTTRRRWTQAYRFTQSHVRAIGVGLALAATALALGRVDVAILATPLLVVAAWGWAAKPRGRTDLTLSTRYEALTEGETTQVTVAVEGPPEVDSVVLHVAPVRHTSYGPRRGLVAAPLDHGHGSAHVTVRPDRWGAHRVGPVLVRVGSALDAYASDAVELDPVSVRVLPELRPYSGRAGVPHPQGLAGANAARHLASGVEFADIRPLTTGDRLRHISWPVSLRTGTLHVRRSHAEVDAEVLLLLDAVADIGDADTEHTEHTETTLDRSVRAAGSLGRYLLDAGNRVGLEVVGAQDQIHLPAAGGRRQLRRLLDALSTVRVGDREWVSPSTPRLQTRPGSLVVIFTPAVSATFLGWAVHLRRSGYQVVVVDTLGGTVPVTGGAEGLAWRLRILERAHELQVTRSQSVPVIPWHGPGTLDAVLFQLARHPVGKAR